MVEPRRKFVLLSTQRSGTGFLATSLESHPEITDLSELFQVRSTYEKSYRAYRTSSLIRRVRQLGDGLIDEFMEVRLSAEPEPLFGFILMYSQAEHYPRVVQWCLENRTRVVHLIRGNLLKKHVSHLIARKRGVWNARVKPERAKVTVNAKSIVRTLDRASMYSRKYAEVFRSLPYMAVEYEDFRADTKGVGERVMEFLGVEKIPLSATTVKVNSDSLRDLIENYDEVEKALLGTTHESFLI